MDLGILIVSYNTCALTADCLAAVYAAFDAHPLEAHVWVIDNASTDGSAAMVRERFPQATLVEPGENLGFARANNLGLELIDRLAAPPSYVLLLNPDTRVAPDALDKMVSFLETHPRVGIVGAQLAYGDGRFQHGAFHFPTLAMALFDFWTINHRLLDSRLNGRYPRSRYAAGAPFPIDHPLGAALLIRREVIRQIGPLDTDFFMYCEEIDWCLRAKKAGWAIYCVPQARVVHLEGQSTRQFRERMFTALWRSRYRLFQKHYSPLYRRLVRLIVRAGLAREMRRTQAALQQGRLSPDEAKRRLAAFQQVREM